MRDADPAPVPGPRELRRVVRGMRRTSVANRPLLETLQNLYVAFFTALLAVVLVEPTAARALSDIGQRSGGPAQTAGLAPALATALLLAALGAGVRALAVLGPLVRDPAEATWLLASPVDRRGMLGPLAVVVLAGCAAVAALVASGCALVAGGWTPWWVLAGGTGGLAAGAAAVTTQGTGRSMGLRRLADVASVAAVVVLVTGLVGGFAHVRAGDDRLGSAGFGDDGLGSGALGPQLLRFGALGVLILLAAAMTAAVPRRLARLRRAELVAGAGLALGLRATVTGLDGSFIAETLRARRLLERGTVRLRPLRGHGEWALVAADARRARRAPRPLLTAIGAVPVVWTVGEVYGRLAATAALALLAWGGATSVAGGLRAISRSPALARSLPYDDQQLRLVHCAVPALGSFAVAVLTVPLGGHPGWWVGVATLVGVSGALRTARGRSPVRWELQATSPMGALPVGAVTSYLVGIDAVALGSLPWLVGAGPALSLGLPAVVVAVLLSWNRRSR